MRRLRHLPVALLLLAPAAAEAEVVNRIVLRVNDQIATLRDYQLRHQEEIRNIMRGNADEGEKRRLLEQAPEVVFSNLYQELLLESRAQQIGVEVPRGQIDAAIENMKQNFGIKTEEEFRAALAQSGMNEPQLRSSLEKNLRAREVMGREVQTRIQLEEEDLRRYYRKNIEQFRQPEQVHLREVVVLETGAATPEERARIAGEIRQAVAGGKSLADAIADLQPRGITSNVIDLGWVTPGDLDPGLETAAWKLAVDAVSEPVSGRGGLHLLQMVERRESRLPPFSEVAETIRRREQERVYNDEFTKYFAELEKKALIVAEPPQEASDFRRLINRPAADGLELEPAAVAEQPGAADTAGRTAPADSTQGEPGALPEPQPVTNSPSPVVEPPAQAPAPPPPPTRR